MKNENVIHVKLEYDEALQAKKDILTSEINLIKIGKNIERYKKLRTEELKAKIYFHRRLKELLILIKNIQKILPKPKIPAILKEGEGMTKIKERIKLKSQERDIDSELQEIQAKLRSLQ